MDNLRIDKWLWAARFFKTRSMAAKAVSGGKVHVNGNRVKASRNVVVGDVLAIQNEGGAFTVTVLGINPARRPAVEARLLYEESEESRLERERQRDLRRMMNAGQTAPSTRPGKRDRRKIKEFVRKNS